METRTYKNYTEFLEGVADAVYDNEIGEHYLLQEFNFGVERKHVAYVGFAELHYNVFDKAPFHAWVDVTEDYIQDFEAELEISIERLKEEAEEAEEAEEEEEDPRDCIGYNKEEYLKC